MWFTITKSTLQIFSWMTRFQARSSTLEKVLCGKKWMKECSPSYPHLTKDYHLPIQISIPI